jgi:hypothetical protein
MPMRMALPLQIITSDKLTFNSKTYKMKKRIIFSLLFCFSAFSIFAQVRSASGQKYSGSAASQTYNPAQMHTMNRIVPIPKTINFMQARKSLRSLYNGSPQAMNVMDNNNGKLTSNSGSAAHNTLGNSRYRAASSVMGMNYTIGKTFSDGHKASFTLTQASGSWETKPVFTKIVKSSVPSNSPPGFNCVTSTQTFNAQSTSFMNANPNEKGSHLVAGCIYSFDDYSSGSFREFTDARNPVTVYTTTTVGNNSSNIQNPNGQSLSQGVSNIINQFSPGQAGVDYVEQYFSSDNQSDYQIQISAGGSYGAFSGSASFTHSESEHHIYVTIDVIKPMFTMSVQHPQNGYFQDGKTPTANSPLVVIQDVTYGARVLANIDIEISAKTNLGSLGLQYNSGVASARLDFNAIANDKTIKYKINSYFVGVPVTTPITTVQDFDKQISNIFAQSNFRTAVPIQYGLTDLDGNSLGIESATDQFTSQNCTPADEVFTLQSVMATIASGEDGKNDNSEFWLEVYQGSPANHSKIAVFYDNKTEFNNKFTPTVNVGFLPAPKPYTLTDFQNGGAILLRLTEHGHSGDDWDISNIKLTFNFISQKGTPYVKPVSLSQFRFSDKSNPVFYFDGNFALVQ